MSKEKFQKLVKNNGGVKEIAHKLGVSHFAIYRWLDGSRKPKSDNIVKLIALSRGSFKFEDAIKMGKNP